MCITTGGTGGAVIYRGLRGIWHGGITACITAGRAYITEGCAALRLLDCNTHVVLRQRLGDGASSAALTSVAVQSFSSCQWQARSYLCLKQLLGVRCTP